MLRVFRQSNKQNIELMKKKFSADVKTTYSWVWKWLLENHHQFTAGVIREVGDV